MNNIFRNIALLVVSVFIFGACSDWTEVESIGLKQQGLEEQNLELYTKYLENLCQYKACLAYKIINGYISSRASITVAASAYLYGKDNMVQNV